MTPTQRTPHESQTLSHKQTCACSHPTFVSLCWPCWRSVTVAASVHALQKKGLKSYSFLFLKPNFAPKHHLSWTFMTLSCSDGTLREAVQHFWNFHSSGFRENSTDSDSDQCWCTFSKTLISLMWKKEAGATRLDFNSVMDKHSVCLLKTIQVKEIWRFLSSLHVFNVGPIHQMVQKWS